MTILARPNVLASIIIASVACGWYAVIDLRNYDIRRRKR